MLLPPRLLLVVLRALHTTSFVCYRLLDNSARRLGVKTATVSSELYSPSVAPADWNSHTSRAGVLDVKF
jgi:hypothetical protein